MSPTTVFVFGLVIVWLFKAGFGQRFLSALGVAMQPGQAVGGGPTPGGKCSGKSCDQMRAELCAAHYPNCQSASCAEITQAYMDTCKG